MAKIDLTGDYTSQPTKSGKKIVICSTIVEGGNLKTSVPNIGIFGIDHGFDNLLLELTWDECRILADNINHIADICEFG